MVVSAPDDAEAGWMLGQRTWRYPPFGTNANIFLAGDRCVSHMAGNLPNQQGSSDGFCAHYCCRYEILNFD